jgi:hypothetical protein
MHRRPFVGFSVHFHTWGRKDHLAVIPKICDRCQQQHVEKPASLYWAWTNADNKRRAWKQKLCLDCVRAYVAPLIIASEQPVLICPACGIGTVGDYDAVYLTYCLPGMPQGQTEMPLCGSCAVAVRKGALEGARELEDRGVGVGGPQPSDPQGRSLWDQLGLAPERRNG